jgi:hypothetical protein
MNKFSLESLTEGIRSRHLGEENARLTEKWTRTGLLRGLDGVARENMGRLLENQAAELLREQSSISGGGGGLASSGDLRGFSNIAFPIVRRVFGGLVANELVSIQPMSLPSGLLFYLDYTYGSNVGGDASLTTGDAGSANQETYSRGDSIYNNPTGKGVRSGSLATGGQYDLAGATYSKVHSSSLLTVMTASGSFGTSNVLTTGVHCHATGTDGRFLQFDPQVTTLIEEDALNGAADGTGIFQFLFLPLIDFADTVDLSNVKDISLFDSDASARGVVALGSDFQGGQNVLNLRRLNQIGTFANSAFTPNPLVKKGDANAVLLAVVSGTYAPAAGAVEGTCTLTASFAIADSLNVEDGSGSTLTIPSFESDFGATPSPVIPEIDIKVESIAVTAATRKLLSRTRTGSQRIPLAGCRS